MSYQVSQLASSVASSSTVPERAKSRNELDLRSQLAQVALEVAHQLMVGVLAEGLGDLVVA